MERLLRIFKQFLTLVGARLPKTSAEKLQAAVNYILIGQWMRERRLHLERRYVDRQGVWSPVATLVRDERVLFLEFGVYRGDSIRWWASALKNPETRLHGFDSFTGLPEDGGPWSTGQFDTGGSVPVIDDPRVKFFKGWFDEILPTYAAPRHDVLVLNMDADLYSSTICVLRALRPHIKRGTFIYFDEFNQITHEARAFDEFMAESGLKFRAVSSDTTLTHIFFQCTG